MACELALPEYRAAEQTSRRTIQIQYSDFIIEMVSDSCKHVLGPERVLDSSFSVGVRKEGRSNKGREEGGMVIQGAAITGIPHMKVAFMMCFA
jgi:hypothetical protein